MNLCDIQPGLNLSGFYLLKQASLRTTAAGKPYLAGIITDRTGSVELKVWDYSGPISHEDEGKIVCLIGRVSEFKGALQVTADRIRLAQENDNYDLSLLVPTAPLDVQRTMEELERMLASMEDAGLQAVCREMLRRHQRAFTTIPAAKSVHHGFVNGLLMHTVTMMKTAVWLAGLYGDFLDRDLLLAGTFLHDFSKIQEFKVSQTGLVTDYTTEGQLLGHLVEIGVLPRQLFTCAAPWGRRHREGAHVSSLPSAYTALTAHTVQPPTPSRRSCRCPQRRGLRWSVTSSVPPRPITLPCGCHCPAPS